MQQMSYESTLMFLKRALIESKYLVPSIMFVMLRIFRYVVDTVIRITDPKGHKLDYKLAQLI